MSAKPRKRAPGGGRKKKSDSDRLDKQTYVRMDSTMRAELEAEAAARGQDDIAAVTREAIKFGLKKMQDRRLPDATQALLFEIGKLADGVSVSSPDGQRFMWNEDAFAFQAFQCALTFFMSKLESELGLDENRVQSSALQTLINEHPDRIDDIWLRILASPERLGERVYERIWLDLITYEPTSVATAKEVLNPDEKMAGKWSQYTYALDNVRRVLGLKRREV